MRKKILAIIAACTILMGATVSGSALDIGDNIFEYGDKEIIIEDTDISADKMQYIADCIADEADDGVSTCGILCIFGHSKKVTQAVQTSHNAYSTSPKCLEETFEVTYCTRSSCDYIVYDLIYSDRTSACHG